MCRVSSTAAFIEKSVSSDGIDQSATDPALDEQLSLGQAFMRAVPFDADGGVSFATFMGVVST